MVAPDIFRRLGLLTAAAPLALGLNAVLRPNAALEVLGYKIPLTSPSPATPTKGSGVVATPQLAAQHVAQFYGARNLLFATLTLLVALSPHDGGDNTLLAKFWVANSSLAFVDGLISRARLGAGKQWAHWGFIPLGLGLSLGLMGYF
ncbi:uncharacterized protein B0I36DRAFT_354932 [Microdochium trichocladiopsis]|uniref:Uncharacterized protein n=1 Tax=Microdochium trichocladiopsis TaxID=1682393 RepID=A0A9P9BIT7_9PEZI|nr:uncharacterized protein B0I36DRAFT_354932 [Microdochium trichocladiopsis]KAH7016061.1 hypothetical protein B0I36DRAFT_354932 [Microdochium trichocladiopsis]